MALCPKTNQPEQDLVFTPDYLAEEILKHYNPSGTMLEPCRGGGDFWAPMHNYTDEVRFCEITEGLDFFDFNEHVNWIITNPPWSKIRQFLDHSFKLDVDNIVYLCNVNAFMTKARLRSIAENGYGIKEFYCVKAPKTNWPQQGFQLAATHIQKGWEGSTKWSGSVGR